MLFRAIWATRRPELTPVSTAILISCGPRPKSLSNDREEDLTVVLVVEVSVLIAQTVGHLHRNGRPSDATCVHKDLHIELAKMVVIISGAFRCEAGQDGDRLRHRRRGGYCCRLNLR